MPASDRGNMPSLDKYEEWVQSVAAASPSTGETPAVPEICIAVARLNLIAKSIADFRDRLGALRDRLSTIKPPEQVVIRGLLIAFKHDFLCIEVTLSDINDMLNKIDDAI